MLKQCIFCKFLQKIFLQIFENSPASGGLRPRAPYEAGQNLEPPEFFSCVRHCSAVTNANWQSLKCMSKKQHRVIFLLLWTSFSTSVKLAGQWDNLGRLWKLYLQSIIYQKYFPVTGRKMPPKTAPIIYLFFHGKVFCSANFTRVIFSMLRLKV